MNAARVTQGAGGFMPRLMVHSWGNYTLPQAGLLPVEAPQRRRGLAGVGPNNGGDEAPNYSVNVDFAETPVGFLLLVGLGVYFLASDKRSRRF